MYSTSAATPQRQIRVFVVAWLGITLLMGALTFAGIYYTTGLVDDGNAANTDVLAAPDNAAANGEAFDPNAIDATQPATASDVALAVPPGDGGSGAANVAPLDGGVARAQDATPIPTLTPAVAQSQAPTEDYQVGIQVQGSLDGNPDVYRIWMGEVRDKLRLKWIKQQIRWENIEPQQGQYDWGTLDISMQLAAEYDIKVMASVLTTPAWAREPGNQRLDEVGPPADPQLFANFLAALVNRYPGQIHAIEVWNEMNLDREWASIYGLSAQRYVQMLSAAYNTVKAIDPNIIIISGALSPTGVNDGISVYDDFVYMDMLIQAGMLNYADCVGAHHNGYNIGPNVPYDRVPNDPTATFRGPFDNPDHSWSFYTTLNMYAQKIQAAGSDTKLCITEFGWASTEGLGGTPRGFEFANDNTLAEQAQFIDEAIQLMDQWGFVWLAFVWNLNYGAQSGWDAANDNVPYSLLRPNWEPAPAYEAIAQYDFRSR